MIGMPSNRANNAWTVDSNNVQQDQNFVQFQKATTSNDHPNTHLMTPLGHVCINLLDQTHIIYMIYKFYLILIT